jgi:hypothetical protein
MTQFDDDTPAGPTASDADPNTLSLDLNRTPLVGRPFSFDPPDPNNPRLDIGQVLYHLAAGARPEDFHPAVQPLAQGLSIGFEPKPPLGPGLLGSAEDIRQAIAAVPGREIPGAEAGMEDAGSDDAEVAPAAVDRRQRFSTTYPRTLDPTVERYVTEYNQAHGLKPRAPEYLDPDLIKAMIRQEAGHDYDALIRDPMQVNGPDGDWDRQKSKFGLRKGVAPGADLSVKAGIQWLRQKAYEHDDQGNETRFRGWPQAVQRYNGRLPDYSDQVWDHLGEIKGGF